MRPVHGDRERRRDSILHRSGFRGERQDHHARRARPEWQAASAAASLDRGAGSAVRFLSERADYDGQGAARQESQPHRCRDSGKHERDALPLHDLLPGSGRHQTRREGHRCGAAGAGEGGGRMTPFTEIPKQVEDALESFSGTRRNLLKSAGLLVVSLAAVGTGPLTSPANAQTPSNAGPYPDVDFHQIDSWIAIREDGFATFYVGKTDCGQGTGTSFRQIMSDELDVAYDKTTCIMGSTDITVDQGGSGGSTAMERDSWPMRRVAAEARRVLLEMGSARLGVPVGQLTVSAGVITVQGDPSRSITYGQLIGGKRFNVALTGNNINATTGVAAVKPVQELKIVGLSPQRYDIPPKVDGSLKWAVDVRLPGMVHARNVKPPLAGAKLVSVDESSVRSLPGFIKVVSKGNYVAVICEREEQAINAARQLKATWEKPEASPFPSSENLFKYMRDAKPTSSSNPIVVGNPDTAMAGAAKVIEADYDVPFQGHTAISPAHAMADPSNGQMTIYSNDMKSYGMRTGVAAFLGMPRERVRVV